MEYVLIYTDEEGVTHLKGSVWTTQEGDFTPPSPGGYEITDTLKATGIVMMHHPAGYRDEWHCAPNPVLGTVLSGTIRIDTSDGDHCVLQPGDQFVAADVRGAGHKIEETSLKPYDLVLVVLDEAAIPNQASAT